MSCAKSELCIFDTARPQVVVENAVFEEIYPTNAVTEKSSTIEFNIIGSNTEYLDLNDTLLLIEVEVQFASKAGTAAPDVTPSNYMFHKLFSDVLVYLNNEKIEGGNGSYADKATIETILNYSTDTKNTTLQAIGYHDSDNERKSWLKEGESLEMCGSLKIDFFDQPKYLIPGVNVKIKLIKNNPIHMFQCKTSTPKITFKNAKLFVRRVKVDQSVLIGHQLGLNTQNAIYPYRKSQLVSYTVTKGSNSFYKDQIFGDNRLPKFVLIAFQESTNNSAFSLDVDRYFHFNVGSISLSRNSDYKETYTQDFAKGSFVTSYVTSLIRNMGCLDKNINNGISMIDFRDTYPFFTFVLAPDFDFHQTQMPKQGNVRLDIKFDKPLQTGISILVYGLFDGEIQINKNRTIFV